MADCLKTGLHVLRGYPDRNTGVLANGRFDAFLLLMLLEHMFEPNIALQTIYNNLTDNAVGLIEVPNFDMVLREKLFSELIGDHLMYFTKETLQTTLHINVFDVIECFELRDDYVISVVVRKRRRLDISHFYDYEVKIKADIDEFLKNFSAKRVAVWGAGHQALAIIALTGIADRIRYVVDSALFKQGKYTPATHLSIVAPAALHSDPVDAVIIIAGSSSDEIAGIIRERFDQSMPVAILPSSGMETV